MQVTETNTDGLKREFRIVVSADDIEAKVAQKLSDLSKTIQLPGFRPGKVPVSLLRNRYGGSLMGEVLEETVNASSQQAITDNGLKPALQPRIEVTKFEQGSDLEYTMAVEVLPDIEPPDFSKLEFERLKVEVSDQDVQSALERIAHDQRTFIAADAANPAESGHVVVIDFMGRVDGEPFEGGTAKGYQLELGSNSLLPGFEDQLIGVKAGEKRSVEVNFPEGYGSELVAGKAAVFEVEVKEVRTPQVAPIDESLAQGLGLDSLDALKQGVRERISREYAGLARARLKRSLLDTLAETQEFEVPSGMIDQELEIIWQQYQEARERGQQDASDEGKDEETLKQEYREIAERRVGLGLLLGRVGEANTIIVQQDEVNRALAEQARRFPGQERKIVERFQNDPQALAQIRAPLFEDKVVDFILEMAKVEEKVVSAEELFREPDDTEPAADGKDNKSAKDSKKVKRAKADKPKKASRKKTSQKQT